MMRDWITWQFAPINFALTLAMFGIWGYWITRWIEAKNRQMLGQIRPQVDEQTKPIGEALQGQFMQEFRAEMREVKARLQHLEEEVHDFRALNHPSPPELRGPLER